MAGILLSCVYTTNAVAGDNEVRTNGKHTVRNISGGAGPFPLAGTVTLLDAFASTKTGVPDFDSKAGTIAYSGAFPNWTRVVTSTGVKYTASAQAVINLGVFGPGATWNSAGSFTRRTKTGTAADGFKASFIVNDPMSFDTSFFAVDDVIEFMLVLETDTSILSDLNLDPGETWSASISGHDETSLNGLGRLWEYSWSTDSSDPSNARFSFSSNPSLGLDDGLVESTFNSLATFDSTTGLHSLSSAFSVSTTLTVAGGQSSFSFGGEDRGDIAGQTAVPEPASLMLVITGLSATAAFRIKRRHGDRGSTLDT